MNIDARTLADMVQAAPGRCLQLWLVDIEDCYETVCGDGYFSYSQRAFFDKDVAELWAQWITSRSKTQPNTLGYNAKVQSLNVAAGQAISSELIVLLNAGSFDWKNIVAYCVEDSGESLPSWQDRVPGMKPRQGG